MSAGELPPPVPWDRNVDDCQAPTISTSFVSFVPRSRPKELDEEFDASLSSPASAMRNRLDADLKGHLLRVEEKLDMLALKMEGSLLQNVERRRTSVAMQRRSVCSNRSDGSSEPQDPGRHPAVDMERRESVHTTASKGIVFDHKSSTPSVASKGSAKSNKSKDDHTIALPGEECFDWKKKPQSSDVDRPSPWLVAKRSIEFKEGLTEVESHGFSTFWSVAHIESMKEGPEDDKGRCSSLGRCCGIFSGSNHGAISNATLSAHFATRGRRLSSSSQSIFIFLEDPESGRLARIYAFCITALILASVLFTLVQTVEEPPVDMPNALVLELVVDGIFFAEIFARFVVCPSRWFFLNNPYNIIDLLAAIPLGLRACALAFGDATMFAEALFCFGPVLRLLKLLRRFEKFHLLLRAFALVFEALPILLFTLFVITLLFSSMIYAVEERQNIPTYSKSIWLTIVTMMTVGYGDVTPKSTAGSICVGILVVSSVLYMAMPLGIIGMAR
eukprot:gnl/TRDRNA2_/TRDRNA2_167607_c0_seq1.p1 gnl/TRDRNA2_/TRDRNA2_167607_c0~~gnl/TRDRNA2_/TRDRNA2_167607_c0_seq1.p1  ORF type:complete len:502 (+),score=71.32 gnl/TRDRNA2_/TRDRNA2_167607_c0_seq1:47-1552(+)